MTTPPRIDASDEPGCDPSRADPGERRRDAPPLTGVRRFRLVSGLLDWTAAPGRGTPLGPWLTVDVGREGLQLASLMPRRFLRTPLRIDWTEVSVADPAADGRGIGLRLIRVPAVLWLRSRALAQAVREAHAAAAMGTTPAPDGPRSGAPAAYPAAPFAAGIARTAGA